MGAGGSWGSMSFFFLNSFYVFQKKKGYITEPLGIPRLKVHKTLGKAYHTLTTGLN